MGRGLLYHSIFLLPIFIILGLVSEEFALGVNEELGGGGAATEGAVTLAAHLIVVVQSGTGMIDITGADDYYVIEFQGTIIFDVHIDNGSIDARGSDVGITDARVVETKRLSSILHISDVTAMPSTAHGVDLTEFDPDFDSIFEYDFLFSFHNK